MPKKLDHGARLDRTLLLRRRETMSDDALHRRAVEQWRDARRQQLDAIETALNVSLGEMREPTRLSVVNRGRVALHDLRRAIEDVVDDALGES